MIKQYIREIERQRNVVTLAKFNLKNRNSCCKNSVSSPCSITIHEKYLWHHTLDEKNAILPAFITEQGMFWITHRSK